MLGKEVSSAFLAIFPLLPLCYSLTPFFQVVEVISNDASAEFLRSNKLNTSHTESLVLGSPYSMSCSLPDHLKVEACTWKHSGERKGGLKVQTQTTCSMTIDKLSEEDMGTWTCQVQHSGSNQYQAASIHVVNDVKKDINVRLPSSLVPIVYTVHLIPFIIPDNFSIAGHVDIELAVVEATSSITMHINDIIIHEKDVTVIDSQGQMLEVVGHQYDSERQFYIIQLAEEVREGNITASVFFTGNLNADLAGFYRSSYTDKESGETRYIATTQFEATDARRAFPCLDEPAMKAVFQINLGRLPSMTSISNMPLEEDSVAIPGTEYVWDIYQPSVKMSTYLIAMVVHDFNFREGAPTDNGVLFRIWSREEGYSQTEWAAEVGPKILEYYEGYFDTPFPLPKQDMIAIPDFSAGAMENWGLITYREVAILYEEGKSSRSDKEYVAVVIAHELAHQWFGDLVTMEWWTDLWLNEGFASYTEYIGTNVVSPETAILDRFVLESVQPALGYDSLLSSHPISIPVNHPDEINQIFDTISYLKGGSVIRMMANFLGLSTFNRAITKYLHENAYGNANQDDLWQYLTEAGQEDGSLTDLTIKEVMDTWTVQMGYPVVDFQRQYEGAQSALVTQDRFLLTGESNDTEDSNPYTWWVPLSFTTAPNGFFDTSPTVWLSPSDADTDTVVPLPGVSDDEPVIANVQQTGFFRVNYDLTNWDMISSLLQSNLALVHRINRAQILDDAFNLARAGLLNYPTALSLTEYLSQEEDYIPWRAALNGFTYLEKMFKRTSGFGFLKSYMLTTLQPLFDRLGFNEIPGESFLDEKLRIAMLSILCRLGQKECTEMSSSLLEEWLAVPDPDTENPIPASVRGTVLCAGIAKGTQTHWDFLWERFLASNNGNEKNDILSALGCSEEIWILEKYLEMALDETSGVRKQDGYRVITGVAHNTAGRYLTWNWVRQNWGKLSTYYDTAISSSVGRIIAAIAEDFNTEWDLKELEDFIEEHQDELGSAAREAAQMVESTKANIKWMDEHYQTIYDWLQPDHEVRTNEISKTA